VIAGAPLSRSRRQNRCATTGVPAMHTWACPQSTWACWPTGGRQRNEHLWPVGPQVRNHPAYARLSTRKAVFRHEAVVDPLAGVALLGRSMDVLEQAAPDDLAVEAHDRAGQWPAEVVAGRLRARHRPCGPSARPGRAGRCYVESTSPRITPLGGQLLRHLAYPLKFPARPLLEYI